MFEMRAVWWTTGIGALWLVGCASSAPIRPMSTDEKAATVTAAAQPAGKRVQVSKDGKVDTEETRLSKGKNERALWELVPAEGTLSIVPRSPETWPLDVRCEGAKCVGTIRSDAKVDPKVKHHYHTRVDGADGPDPNIIIEG